MDADKIVAENFTGPDVAHQSIMLKLPAKHTYACAERFFKARAALGISGYMDAKEALAAIKAKRKALDRTGAK